MDSVDLSICKSYPSIPLWAGPVSCWTPSSTESFDECHNERKHLCNKASLHSDISIWDKRRENSAHIELITVKSFPQPTLTFFPFVRGNIIELWLRKQNDLIIYSQINELTSNNPINTAALILTFLHLNCVLTSVFNYSSKNYIFIIT